MGGITSSKPHNSAMLGLLTYQLTYLLTCLEVARRLATRVEDASERDQAGRGRVAMDAVHGDRVVAAVGGEHEVAARVDRHAAAPVPKTTGSTYSGGLLSAPDHASGCLELRPASANPPLGPRWPAGHTGLGFNMGPHVLSSRGNAEGSVETVCTRLRVGLHERSSSARSCGAVRANMLSISEATSGWYWKTATWLG